MTIIIINFGKFKDNNTVVCINDSDVEIGYYASSSWLFLILPVL